MILQAEKAKINNQLTQIDSEISKLLAELEAKRQSLKALEEAENLASEALERLKFVVASVSGISAPGAISTLKTAVLNLFPDDGNDSGGNQPDSPTPPVSPNSGETDDSDEPELLCLNGITGDYLLDSNEPDATEPQTLEPLGVLCCEFASPICCQLEDAPESSLVGQSYELCSGLEDKPAPFVELITHSDNPSLAYQRKHDGEILCAYFGFSTKRIAQSWKEFIEAIAFRVELRQAKRMTDFRWEVKAAGMSKPQIDRLAKNCDFTKAYQPQAPKAESPAQSAGIEPPSDWGKVRKTPILEEGDICQVMEGQFKDQQGAVCSVSRFSEKPIGLQLPSGVVRYFYRTELKLVSKGSGDPKPQRQQLQTGDVLMGSRVVTTGAFVGVSATVRANNAARGLETKLAAAQLMKSGLTPELAMAAATGTQVDDASDF